MNWDNLISGLAGALIGASASMLLYWHSRYASAKRNLLDKLIFFKSDVYWQIEDRPEKVHVAWRSTLVEIWSLYNLFYDWVPVWNKKKISSAWHNYKGESQEVIKALPHVDSRRPPENKQQLLEKTQAFIRTIHSC